MKHKILVCLTMLFIMITITACSQTSENKVKQEEINNITYDKVLLQTEILSLIKKEKQDENIEYKYVMDEFIINENDTIQNSIIKVNNEYFVNNAYYIQIETENNNYIYRFQLSDNKVKSYIKYNLEG